MAIQKKNAKQLLGESAETALLALLFDVGKHSAGGLNTQGTHSTSDYCPKHSELDRPIDIEPSAWPPVTKNNIDYPSHL